MGCLRLALLALYRANSTQSILTFTDHLIISTNGKPGPRHTSHCVAVRFIEMTETSEEHFNPLKLIMGFWEKQHQEAPSQTSF